MLSSLPKMMNHTLLSWRTKAKHLKIAVRWGIIKTQSITSKVISELGKYRVVAHERIAKGMVSNSQEIKLRLLNLYQDRFEALQELESMVNKGNNANEYESKINSYIKNLEIMQDNLLQYFAEVSKYSGFNLATLEAIKQDLDDDIKRAKSYLKLVNRQDNLDSFNRARGQNSILEFVKQQMMHGLYELQGINQDITNSHNRDFALTRGELNDNIEDARKVIDDHQADLRNAVNGTHHACFSQDDETLVSYDFTEEDLSPERERELLLAISFIEGWDKVDYKSLTVSNKQGTEKLDVYNATKWKNHRNFSSYLKSAGYFIINFFQSIILPTKPWEEESWQNEGFHLEAAELRKHSAFTEPMWQKPRKLLKQIGNAFFDAFKGVRDFGGELVIKLPDAILNDWDSCNELLSLTDVYKEAEAEIAAIIKTEDSRLIKILRECNFESLEQNPSAPTSILASVDYELTAGEQNDFLTSIVRGVNEAASVLSHKLCAKDPIDALMYTGSLAVGASAIYFPTATASIFGSAYVNWFSNFAYSLGSSKLAAAAGGGSTQAQLVTAALDALVHGPSGFATNAFYKLGEDPVTIGAYIAAATGLGYGLVNGIGGYTIPWLSPLLKEDLGKNPALSYPFIGAKFAVLLYEGFMLHKKDNEQLPHINPELVAKARALQLLNPEQQKIINRFILVSWLSLNAEVIPKLKAYQLFELSRHIDAPFR